MQKKLWLTFILALMLVLSSCVNPNAPAAPAEQPAEEAAEEPAAEQPAEEAAEEPAAEEAVEEPAAEEAAEEPAAATVSEFHAAWPFTPPPAGHFNTFAPSDSFQLGIYQNLMEPSLFMYKWADDTWVPVAGTEWSWKDDTTLEVKLIEGAVWSDGSAFTSQDVVDTMMIYRLLNTTVWRSLKEVKAVDDHTVEFVLNEPSNIVPRYVLRNSQIHASSVYGEWAKKTADLVAAGKTPDDAEWKDLLTEFNAFRPEDMVVLGPYKIDPASITEATLVLNKVPTSYWADTVKFDKIVNYNGETPVITPLVLSGDVDYATHGFPPATVQEFQNLGYRVLRPPIYNGPVIGFNMKVHPFELKEFRQAVAYAIDRAQNGQVAFAESGVPVKWMTGMSDNFVDTWMTEEAKGKLNTYDYDPAKAEEILTGLGFERDSDNVWMDDTGERLEFEFLFQAEFADWSAAAKNACEQLTVFGIKCTGRSITFTQFDPEVNDGKFELASLTWGSGNPHPQFSFSDDFRRYNQALSGVGDPTKPGISFPMEVETESVGAVDLNELIDASGAGADMEAQKEAISQLALAFNELMPMVPLWERYGNNPAPSRFAAGWLPDDDPIYKNSPYGDSFVIIQILDGTLHPAAAE